MEHQKVSNLLNQANDVGNYDVGKEIIYNTKVSKSNLCDYNDGYVLVRDENTIIGH